jgi:Flp pilus assembly protein TadD
LTPESPSNRSEVLDYVFWWMSPLLLLVLGAMCWVNHFDAGFHRDDFPNIVNNRNVTSGNLGALLTSPRSFSTQTALADYRPLLSLLYVFDNSVRRDGSPAIFQLTSFLWFIPLPFFIYGLARALPAAQHQSALLAAALFAVHPLVADVVNYISGRGELIAAGGVACALFVWIMLPERLPSTLGLDRYKIPKTATERFIFDHGAGFERLYKSLLRPPTHYLYFVPLIVALLCSPAATAFALLASAYTWVYASPVATSADVPSGRIWARVIPGAVICGGWFILHTALTWSYQSPLRIPALHYWLSQPRVAMQYFVWFFTPWNLSADGGLLPELRFWPPDILLGIVGVAALVALAVWARRRPEWRGLAFGIAWFLLAQLPFFLVPQTTADSGARMFLPSLGLAIATAHVLMHFALRAQTLAKAPVVFSVLASLAILGILVSLGLLTWKRNAVWSDDLSLSRDSVQRSPNNQRALIQYAQELISRDDLLDAREIVARAHTAAPQDARSEVSVAETLDRIGRDSDAETHYKRATMMWPRFAGAISSFGSWLIVHQRLPEAADWSQRAIRLNVFDNQARHNLMDIHSAAFEWTDVSRVAKAALAVDPDDERAKLALTTSQDVLDRVGRAERRVSGQATFNDYLTLSVAYYRAKRYQDCVGAAKEALKQQGQMAEAYANMSACYHSLGQDDEALTALREVVRLRPDMAFAWSNLQILEAKKREKPTKVK